VGTRFGQLQGTFVANEMSICKQDLMLQEQINCETTISVREAASNQSFSGGKGFLKCSCQSKCSISVFFLFKIITINTICL
jgi:hypothetical protein